ncbi:MAG: ARPP-1 family domain-containing protein [Solirubrobacteraceae bacterium]
MTTDTAVRFHVGAPQISGPLAVYPIFGPEPRLLYRGLAHAIRHGAFVTEVGNRGSVNDVLVCNASDQPVLLYEGELIAGARQNRTIDQPVLVPAGAQVTVRVSCVEHGRWDDDQGSDHFTVVGHTADPDLRRTKRATANRRSARGDEGRPQQIEVWQEVDARLEMHAVAAPSQAFTDLFDAKRPVLDQITEPIHARDEQLGAVVEIAGKPAALDLVSRPDAFADLLPRLADGYALQLLELCYMANPPRGEADDAGARRFLELVLGSRQRWVPTPGIGDAFVPTRRRIAGCGLRADRELVALSAFPAKRS